jgi:hypothetical protein
MLSEFGDWRIRVSCCCCAKTEISEFISFFSNAKVTGAQSDDDEIYNRLDAIISDLETVLVFLLYINDVVEAFRDSKCTCKLYADDLKIYTEIQLTDDLNLLQSALDALYE